MLLVILTGLALAEDNDDHALKEDAEQILAELENPADLNAEIDKAKEQLRNNPKNKLENNMAADFNDDDMVQMICDKPHTLKSADGFCVCEEGFQGADAALEGCWKCNQTCHALGVCRKDGECVCQTGYVGDGVTECEVQVPILAETRPIKCVAGNCVLNISFTNRGAVTGLAGYCKFDNILVQSENVYSDGYMVCYLPHTPEKKVKMTISFDSRHFSKQYVTVLVSDPDMDQEVFLVFVLLGSVIFVIGIAIFRTFQAKKRGVRFADHDPLIAGKKSQSAPSWF
jgi:hypothetical protein